MDSIKISISVMLFEGDGRPPKYTTSFGRLPPCHLSQTLANIALYNTNIYKYIYTNIYIQIYTNTNTRPSQTLANIALYIQIQIHKHWQILCCNAVNTNRHCLHVFWTKMSENVTKIVLNTH